MSEDRIVELEKRVAELNRQFENFIKSCKYCEDFKPSASGCDNESSCPAFVPSVRDTIEIPRSLAEEWVKYMKEFIVQEQMFEPSRELFKHICKALNVERGGK